MKKAKRTLGLVQVAALLASVLTVSGGMTAAAENVDVTEDVLTNPGFEEGLEGWNTLGDKLSPGAYYHRTTKQEKHSGEYSANFAGKTRAEDQQFGLTQTLTGLEANTNYKMTFWVKGNGILDVSVADAAGELGHLKGIGLFPDAYDGPDKGKGGFAYYDVFFHTGADASNVTLKFVVGVKDGAMAYMDDVTIAKLDNQDAPASSNVDWPCVAKSGNTNYAEGKVCVDDAGNKWDEEFGNVLKPLTDGKVGPNDLWWKMKNGDAGHWFYVDLGAPVAIRAITHYLVENEGDNVGKYKIYVSNSTEDWGEPVADNLDRQGTTWMGQRPFIDDFFGNGDPVGRYVKFEFESWCNVREVQVWGTPNQDVPGSIDKKANVNLAEGKKGFDVYGRTSDDEFGNVMQFVNDGETKFDPETMNIWKAKSFEEGEEAPENPWYCVDLGYVQNVVGVSRWVAEPEDNLEFRIDVSEDGETWEPIRQVAFPGTVWADQQPCRDIMFAEPVEARYVRFFGMSRNVSTTEFQVWGAPGQEDPNAGGEESTNPTDPKPTDPTDPADTNSPGTGVSAPVVALTGLVAVAGVTLLVATKKKSK